MSELTYAPIGGGRYTVLRDARHVRGHVRGREAIG